MPCVLLRVNSTIVQPELVDDCKYRFKSALMGDQNVFRLLGGVSGPKLDSSQGRQFFFDNVNALERCFFWLLGALNKMTDSSKKDSGKKKGQKVRTYNQHGISKVPSCTNSGKIDIKTSTFIGLKYSFTNRVK